jgi:hypothetical protein
MPDDKKSRIKAGFKYLRHRLVLLSCFSDFPGFYAICAYLHAFYSAIFKPDTHVLEIRKKTSRHAIVRVTYVIACHRLLTANFTYSCHSYLVDFFSMNCLNIARKSKIGKGKLRKGIPVSVNINNLTRAIALFAKTNYYHFK